MSQSEPLPINSVITEQLPVSPAAAEIMERAHEWAENVLERFESKQKNVVLMALSDFNASLGYAFHVKEYNPEMGSKTVEYMREIRNLEAAKNPNYEEKKVA